MSSPLSQEIFDLIIDFLYDEPDALKACCLVCKSWVHRTRKHLFAHVEFTPESDFKLWQKTFLCPSNSPAHYTRSLSIRAFEIFTLVDTDVGDWIRAFSGVIRLQLAIIDTDVSLAPLYGLSTTLKSLSVDRGSSASCSEIFGLMRSLPLLEDLAFAPSEITYDEVDEWNIPLTSPKLTGCLDLRVLRIRPIVRRLLKLPNGPHFSKICLSCHEEDVESMTDLVSRCSDTLESLKIRYYRPAEHSMSWLDLSKLTKLRDVVFWCPSIQRIIMTLRTAESINLEQIAIHFPFAFVEPTVEAAHREWRDLDRLLVQFWTSRSIRPKIIYEQERGGSDLGDVAPRLLPELTSRGVIDSIKINESFLDSPAGRPSLLHQAWE